MEGEGRGERGERERWKESKKERGERSYYIELDIGRENTYNRNQEQERIYSIHRPRVTSLSNLLSKCVNILPLVESSAAPGIIHSPPEPATRLESFHRIPLYNR